jgi:ATP-dependent Clp protease ATP-binding subunit ClpA
MRLGQGVAVNVLQKMGFDLETIRIEVEKQVGSGSETKIVGNIPYTPRVKKVLALAGKEAKKLSHTYVGTEHLLLGLLREGEGVAAHALKNLEVDIERTRIEILKELDPDFTTPKAQPDAPMPPPFRMNFTPKAQQVLAKSRKEADRFNHNYVGTEHLLLGIISLGQGVAVNVIQKMGLDLETLRVEVEKQVGSGSEKKIVGNVPYTPRVKKVLALAGKEAKSFHHSYLGTEHLLLGILRDGEGLAARALKNLGVDLERTRNEVLKELDPNFTPGANPTPQQPKPAQSWLRRWWPPWKR